MEERVYIPLSYISQYWYCPRRAGLLMVEAEWEDNIYTVLGAASHSRVHDSRIEKRGGLVKLYEYSVCSEKLGLRGYCDCLEATRVFTDDMRSCEIGGLEGGYTLYPVEYKHGTVRDELEYNIQLCAQAMCLEEMFGCEIGEGAVFYTDSHRRFPIKLDAGLREKVVSGAEALHEISEKLFVPRPAQPGSPKCVKCSLSDKCMPKLGQKTSEYITRLKTEATCKESPVDENEKAR